MVGIRQFVLTSQAEEKVGEIISVVGSRADGTTELSAVCIESEKRIRILHGGVDRKIFVADF